MTENKDDLAIETGAAFWRRVYGAVVLTTVIVVTALWAFGKYFS